MPTTDRRLDEVAAGARGLAEIVFLPSGEDMPDREWERLISVLQEVACVAESNSTRELAAMSGVSASS